MAKLFGGQKNFSTEGKKGMDEYEVMPTDWYPCVIVDSDYKKNSKETGHLIPLKFKVVDGKYKGRLVWGNLNIDHPNTETQEIAEKELVSIIQACGKNSIQDTDELHNIVMEVKIGYKPAMGKYPEGNEPKAYRKAKGSISPGIAEEKGDKKKKKKGKKPEVSFE